MSAINPKHYQIKVKGHKLEVIDIVEATCYDDSHVSRALEYILRAGKKSESTWMEDINKAIWYLCKAILFAGGKIELPEGVVPKKTAHTPRRAAQLKKAHKR